MNHIEADRMPPLRYSSVTQQILAVGMILVIWFICRWIFGTSLAGSDDSFYVRYAHLMHRVPINHWEARSAFIWFLRACFLTFGYSEYASWMPGLFSSLLILIAIAFLFRWPRYNTLEGWSAMLLAATIPVDVLFSTYPVASSMAVGLLSLGTVGLLQESSKWRYAGATLLSFSFITHEYCLYYVAIACVTALVFDFRGYLKPVAICVGISLTYLMLECSFYYFELGQPAYRFLLSSAGMGDNRINIEAGGSAVRFYLMPLQQLFFNKSLGIDLMALLLTGAAAFRCFNRQQRLLCVIAGCYWLWASYGPMTPWEYKPPSREIRLLFPYILPISYLLPSAFFVVFSHRVAILAVVTIVAVHIICLASGGRWQQASRNSLKLLDYAVTHSQTRFVTDIDTLNSMYIWNGCRLPENVVCVPSPRSDECLLVNREPKQVPIRLDTSNVSAFLHNREVDRRNFDPELQDFVSTQILRVSTQRTRVLKPIFRPFSRWLPNAEFFVLNDGWEIVEFFPLRGIPSQ